MLGPHAMSAKLDSVEIKVGAAEGVTRARASRFVKQTADIPCPTRFSASGTRPADDSLHIRLVGAAMVLRCDVTS